jgi:hypothetical protein
MNNHLTNLFTFLYRGFNRRLYLFFFCITTVGCSSSVTVPDSQLMRQPLASVYEFNIPCHSLWLSARQVLKANGWKIHLASEDMGIMSLYRKKTGITSWMTVVIRASKRGSTIRFHCIHTMRPESPDDPEMGKTTVFISLQSWEPLI